MKAPDGIIKNHRCSLECPRLQTYIHPFWSRNAWCSYTLKDLFWYDGAWIAQCEQVEPDAKNSILVLKGWNGNPKYKT